MKRVKILAIAPYDGLSDLMKNTAMEHDNIELHVYTGDLEAGAKLALSIQDLEDFDVIISRGGTADMIQKIAHIPVIEIRLTEFDMMRSIKLAQNYNGKFAIVGFPNITSCTDVICDLLQCNIDTYTINSIDEVSECVSNLEKIGYSLLVGDVVTVSTAKKLGMNGILITSGKESISSAFTESVKLCNAMQLTKDRTNLYRNILNNCNENILVYNMDKKLIYTNFSYKHPELNTIQKKLTNYIDTTIKEKDIKLILKSENNTWSTRGILMEGKDSDNQIAFYINKLFDISSQDEDLYTVKNIEDEKENFHINFYNSSSSARVVVNSMNKISGTNFPVLIYGEKGTGKDSAAYYIHSSSNLKNQPFIKINCSNLSEKQISNLLYSENSPLTVNDITIYLRNIHCLSKSDQSQFVTYIEDSFLHKRNRIIYSSEFSLQDSNGSILMDYLISNSTQSCLTLTLPPLREFKEDIPSLASIYISELNLELGKQVAGFSEKAIELLKNFEWQLNFDQFINVLKKLLIITDTSIINEDDTAHVIYEENRLINNKQVNHLKTTGTLDDIVSDIIQVIMQEEDMNQTKVAQRLGISRSTLWRKLRP